MPSNLAKQLAPSPALAIMNGLLKGIQERKKEEEERELAKAEAGRKMIEALSLQSYRQQMGGAAEIRAKSTAEYQSKMAGAREREVGLKADEERRLAEELYTVKIPETRVKERRLEEVEIPQANADTMRALSDKLYKNEQIQDMIENRQLAARQFAWDKTKPIMEYKLQLDRDIKYARTLSDLKKDEIELTQQLIGLNQQMLAQIDNAAAMQRLQLTTDEQRRQFDADYQLRKDDMILLNGYRLKSLDAKQNVKSAASKAYLHQMDQYLDLTTSYGWATPEQQQSESLIATIEAAATNLTSMYNQITASKDVPKEDKLLLFPPSIPQVIEKGFWKWKKKSLMFTPAVGLETQPTTQTAPAAAPSRTQAAPAATPSGSAHFNEVKKFVSGSGLTPTVIDDINKDPHLTKQEKAYLLKSSGTSGRSW